MLNGKKKGFQIAEDGMLRINGRIYVLDNEDIRHELLEEAYTMPYSVHPRTTKIYQDLKEHFWWLGIK